MNVLVTGAGKAVGLGFNLVVRYLEAGDTVVATIRKACPELMELKQKYSEKLITLTMDIGDTSSVEGAATARRMKLDHLDLIINNAVQVSPDCDKGFFEANLDYIPNTVNVTSVGAMRVVKAFYPMSPDVLQRFGAGSRNLDGKTELEDWFDLVEEETRGYVNESEVPKRRHKARR